MSLSPLANPRYGAHNVVRTGVTLGKHRYAFQ